MSELSSIFVMFGHRPEHPGGNMAYLLNLDSPVKPEDDRGEEKRSGHDGERDALTRLSKTGSWHD